MNFKGFLNWFDTTSRPFGWVVLFMILIIAVPTAIGKTFFTGTCYAADWKCQYAWSTNATNAMSGLVNEVLNDNPQNDIVIVPKGKKSKSN